MYQEYARIRSETRNQGTSYGDYGGGGGGYSVFGSGGSGAKDGTKIVEGYGFGFGGGGGSGYNGETAGGKGGG